ncbi:hypothetical protein SARC_02192 [Sphaeroforma arctica JP610]|uniref:Uncharacterized protein n=1 Tax=Sphaeroforma arctica JP610 TaxID=667725 RepID=A0A0L0G9N8_9EUKA|nr:hypothetical protein SARC_02192 [Sphaeroforma arctica JP610]KNC85619.1 hypothetical protein SARC_02192 [Sphaeroforma arctica JP610]|eukprot:XP_014159521.1 hypothetical protein SARC_02192 [Sphaeroforma arctica JP610]
MKVAMGFTVLYLTHVAGAIMHRLNADVKLEIDKIVNAYGHGIVSYKVLEPVYEFGAKTGDTDVGYRQVGVCVCTFNNENINTHTDESRLQTLSHNRKKHSCECNFALETKRYTQRLMDKEFGTSDETEPYPWEPFELLDNEELNEPYELEEPVAMDGKEVDAGNDNYGENEKTVEEEESDVKTTYSEKYTESDFSEGASGEIRERECEINTGDNEVSGSDIFTDDSNISSDLEIGSDMVSEGESDFIFDSDRNRDTTKSEVDKTVGAGPTHTQKNASSGWGEYTDIGYTDEENGEGYGSNCDTEKDSRDTRQSESLSDSPYPTHVA